MYFTQDMFRGLWLLGPCLGPDYRVASEERRAEVGRDTSSAFLPQGKLPNEPRNVRPSLGVKSDTPAF